MDKIGLKAMVLAAGEGTRLRPLTLEQPKAMLPVAGRPLLEHLIKWLRRYGVTEIAINLHHRPEAISAHFGDGQAFGVSITYSYEEQLLGTAGAVKRMQPFFDRAFVVVYGDVLTDLDLGRLIGAHTAHGEGLCAPWATLALYRVANPSVCGLVETDGQGRVKRFVEKPLPEEAFTDLANAGVMVLEPGILDYVPAGAFCDFGHDLLPKLLAEGVPLFGQPIGEGEFLLDIGTPEAYARAEQIWRGRR